MSSPQFGRSYFEHTYRDYATQNPERKLAFYHRLVRSHLAHSGNVVLLDIGCGPGLFLGLLAKREPSWELSGSEVSKYALERAGPEIAGVAFVESSATDQPMANGSCDVVTAWDVLEHVPDRDKAARAISRMLAPEGIFAFVVPVYDGFTGLLVRALDHDPTHVHKTARRDWLDWAARHFEVVSWLGIFRVLLPGRLYIHRSTSRWRSHSPAIAVMCRRRPHEDCAESD